MGRKIPKNRRHKKLKFVDPAYTGPGPLKRGKSLLYNNPPISDDVQTIPKSMERFIEMKDNLDQFKQKKKRKKVIKDDFIVVNNEIVEPEEPGMKKTKKLPSVVKQNPDESENEFFERLDEMIHTAEAEVEIEEKYNMELAKVGDHGDSVFVPVHKEVSQHKREKRKKRKEKKDEKKRLKKEDEDETEFDLKKEKVKFGEVVSAPPVFTAKLKRAPEFNKAGKRKLFLKGMLPSSTLETNGSNHSTRMTTLPIKGKMKIKTQTAQVSTKDPPAKTSTKLKYLPADRRKALEFQRLKAVEMYRMMKSKKD